MSTTALPAERGRVDHAANSSMVMPAAESLAFARGTLGLLGTSLPCLN